MSDDKIRISWDDISRPHVDERVRQQEMVDRAQQHYAQHGNPPNTPGGAPAPIRSAAPSLLYNTVFYMALFGFLGGGAAWIAGELIMLAIPSRFEAFLDYANQVQLIEEGTSRGEIPYPQATAQKQRLDQQYAGNPYVEIVNDNSLSEAERELQLEQRQSRDGWRSFIQQTIWFALLGMLLAFSLAIGDHVVARNWIGAVINGAVGIVVGLIGGVIVGMFINQLYQALGGGRGDSLLDPRQIFARALGWAILGMFLSIAPGIVLRNPKRLVIGLAGGFLGGLVGGLLFDPISAVTHNAVVSRCVAILAIGSIAGLGTGLIELAAKTGWLKVAAGLIAGKQFILYKNPTFFGSSPQCEVYLFKDPQVGPQHAAIHAVPGGYDLQDLSSSHGTLVNGRRVSRVRLRTNDLIQIGSTTLQFQEKQR